jgi:hypothetical protein
MSNTAHGTTRWTPEAPAERDLVIAELNAILSSYHFRGSKRYPALLKYVVYKTLDGRSEELKERTLGVEVFGRQTDYDTSADPVVRFSASETRKRIAQYYHEKGESSLIQIHLPLGSYVPEFKLKREPAGPVAPVAVADAQQDVAPDASARRRSPAVWWVAAALLLALASFGAYTIRKASAPSVTNKLWGPVLRSPGSILVVVGTSDSKPLQPTPTDTLLPDHMRGPYQHITMSTALALSRLAGVLRANGKTYEIKDEREATLTDFRSRPVILIGGMNNLWTMRLTGPLRFRLLSGPLLRIQDTKNPQSTEWSAVAANYSSVATDYALIARYHDATTNGNVLVIAGLGSYGTEAASEFVVSPQYLDQLLSNAPAGWENKNLEIVIKTEVINGEAGPPRFVSSTVW